jgi:3-deoxy-manno-octulosonate cytidylyltransferase (CMP-KDO synthetase)
MSKSLCVIPARLASSRFPRKPMMPILGMPMIGHVALRCILKPIFSRVIVATCDKEMFDYCKSIRVDALMTSNSHERASDRVQEAAHLLESKEHDKFDIVTMVQGDEPMVTPSMLEKALASLSISSAPIANLISRIHSRDEYLSSNCVKIVKSLKGEALLFSRSPIPNNLKMTEELPISFKQIGVISFQRDFLDTFSTLAPTYLEEVESIDMNRILDHGMRIFCVEVEEQTFPVDIPADLIRVEELGRRDPLLRMYLQ